jgi:hypothetical protein
MPLFIQDHVQSFPRIVFRSRSGPGERADIQSMRGNSLQYCGAAHFAALPGREKPLI